MAASRQRGGRRQRALSRRARVSRLHERARGQALAHARAPDPRRIPDAVQRPRARVDAVVTAIVTVQNVEKSFGPRRVLGGVSFAVHENDRVGLVGLNGSGKSTLLRLVADPSDGPDAGLITRMRDLTIEYVPQEPRLDGALTVAETLRGGLRVEAEALPELEYEVRGLAAALALPVLHRRVADLSIGERRR